MKTKKTLTLKTQLKAGDTATTSREAGAGMATGRRQHEPLNFSLNG